MSDDGRSRERLAIDAQVSPGTVYNIREGLSGASVDVLGRLSDELNVPMAEFFRDDKS